jgi:hypothetical protein
MVDSPTCIVLPSSNRNRVGSMGRDRCSGSELIRVWARCSHKNLIACMELGRTLSRKVSTYAFLFKATKGN